MVNSLQGLAFIRQKRPFVCHSSRVFANILDVVTLVKNLDVAGNTFSQSSVVMRMPRTFRLRWRSCKDWPEQDTSQAPCMVVGDEAMNDEGMDLVRTVEQGLAHILTLIF